MLITWLVPSLDIGTISNYLSTPPSAIKTKGRVCHLYLPHCISRLRFGDRDNSAIQMCGQDNVQANCID